MLCATTGIGSPRQGRRRCLIRFSRIQSRQTHQRSVVSLGGLETQRADPGPPDLSEDAGPPHTDSEKSHKHDRFRHSRPESGPEEANKSAVSCLNSGCPGQSVRSFGVYQITGIMLKPTSPLAKSIRPFRPVVRHSATRSLSTGQESHFAPINCPMRSQPFGY